MEGEGQLGGIQPREADNHVFDILVSYEKERTGATR